MPIAAPPSLSKFDDWAEDTFEASGSGGGVTINQARRDRRGWDFLAEWDTAPASNLPLDRQKLSRTARVQVKSNKRAKAIAVIKLSNALRFAESHDPCFVVLYHLSRDKKTVDIYAKHFDNRLVERVLKRARQADADGIKDLHKLVITIPMDSEDFHSEDLFDWIKSICEGDPKAYTDAKSAYFETVGYEGSRYTASIRLPLARYNALVEHAVGFTPTFDPDWIELKDARFGIPASMPYLEGKAKDLVLLPKEHPSQMIFEGTDSQAVTIAGVSRFFRNLTKERTSLVGSFISRYVQGRLYDDQRLAMNYSVTANEVDEIRRIFDIVSIMLMINEGAVNVTLKRDGVSVSTGQISVDKPLNDPDFFSWVRYYLRSLQSVMRSGDHPKLSIDNLVDKLNDVVRFHKCIAEGLATLKLDLDENYDGSPEITNLFGFASVRIGNSTFACFYRQQKTSLLATETAMTVEFGDPEVIEGWAKGGTARVNNERIVKRFRQLLDQEPSGTVFVNGGDIMAGTIQVVDLRIKN
jgi:hypothetical protein